MIVFNKFYFEFNPTLSFIVTLLFICVSVLFATFFYKGQPCDMGVSVLCCRSQCVVLNESVCCVTGVSVLCYRSQCVLLQESVCCVTVVSVLCYRSQCVVLQESVCCVTGVSVLC